jgi:hypothetical protein
LMRNGKPNKPFGRIKLGNCEQSFRCTVRGRRQK